MGKTKKRIKAVSYLRVSGKGQIRKDGFPRQRETVRSYARAAGYDLVEEFRDEGISGTTELEDRQGLAALLDRLESNGVRTILVERADRLARDLMVSEIILNQFRELGVNVIAADSGTDLTVGNGDPTRKLIRQVLGAVAEFEKSILVLKLKAARVRIRKRNGHCEGRKPFGYYEGESEVLKRMKELYRKPTGGDKRGFYTIARLLNEEGLSTRTGKPWTGTAVRRILLRK